ncbi:MAG: CxxC motif-containing protein (DUF1111 family) [Flavobacteriales bacterium]|jgi:CxxC motif-containing protein (DUF1111 family)
MVYFRLTGAMIFCALSACGGSGSSTSPSPISSPISSPTPSPAPSQSDPVSSIDEHLPGGSASVNITNSDAFSKRSANLTDNERIIRFNLGNDFFENPWVSGSASTSSRDGLGALFNNNACQDCHIRDGRGHAPNACELGDECDFGSLLFRAARVNISDEQALAMAQSLRANVGDSSVGGQLQHDSIVGVQAEVNLGVAYTEREFVYSDGETTVVREPVWQFESSYVALGYDFDADIALSPRVAPPMIGLGLVALISELDIVAREDVNDADGDGVSGRANYVWSIEEERVMLGRFGWKAGQPSLIEQAAGAFLNDMGLTSRIHKEEPCLSHQHDCLAAENGNGDAVEDYNYEVSDKILDSIAFYSANLAVPQRRNAYANNVQNGKRLFIGAGCIDCHTEQYETESSADFPELSNQRIFPYSDFLLHDMGENLAGFDIDNHTLGDDVRVEFLASAREWRTPPLWGLGLAKVVDTNANFLHDGRARNIMEAVLWHGGEAENSKQAVLNLSAAERIDLLAFLNDL